MDFLDPKKRRRHTIQLLTGYVLVAVAVLMATTVLFYYANGFGVSRDGSLEQRGLVFVSSQPTGADLYVNGKKKKQTNTKLNIAVGKYDFILKKTGYEDWAKNIIVEGGRVDHYTYPLLIPQDLTSTTVNTLDTQPNFVTQSPDKRWLMTQTALGDEFLIFDLDKPQESVGLPEAYTAPAELLSPSFQPATWTVVEWSTNNRHILMKRSYTDSEGAKNEYVLLDRQRPDGSHNLTQEFALTASQQLTLRDKNPELYYVYSPDTSILSTASLDKPVPEEYQTGVLAFKSHGKDLLLYVTNDEAGADESRVILRENSKSYFIRAVARSDAYLLDLARYDGKMYVAAGSKSGNRVFYYKNPIKSINRSKSGLPAALFVLRQTDPLQVSFSANAQFLAVQNGKIMYVYDNEFERAYKYDAPAQIDGPLPFATWMGGHHMTNVSSGKQVIFDYDGKNFSNLVATDSNIGGFFDRNNRYLYTFNTIDGVVGTQMVSTPLRTPDDL